MGEKKMKIMLYSTLVEVEVEVGVELGKNWLKILILGCRDIKQNSSLFFLGL